jgi:hypothetical protein
MIDPIRELNIRAKLLHHGVEAGVVSATERLRALPELRRASSEHLTAFAARVQRKHCLAAAAREAGFHGWDHATRVLGGDENEPDHGDMLYPKGAAAFLNHWFATYDEAHEVHAAGGGYLLAFRRQAFIAGRDYIAITLALDPDDADWASLGFDWVRPRYAAARRRLYGKLLAKRREAA